jgi:hypothetical protein
MIRGMPRRYTAIQYAVFDPLRHELQIASAGRPEHFISPPAAAAA